MNEYSPTREWWLSVHGTLMATAVCIALPLSLCFPLYLRRKYPNWLDLHLRIHLVGFLLASAGILIAYFTAEKTNKKSEETSYDASTHYARLAHSMTGIAISLGVGFVLPMLGLPDETDEQSAKRRSLDRHGFVGKFMFFSCAFQVGLGLYLFAAPTTAWVIYWIWLAAIVSFVVWQWTRTRRSHRRTKTK